MYKPRSQVVLSDRPALYHCTNRCVRQAFLLGQDHASGKDFSHRKGWIKDLLQLLLQAFAVKLLAYTIMDNHYHLVLMSDPKGSLHWSDEEVARRWILIFPRYAMGNSKAPADPAWQMAQLLGKAGEVERCRAALSNLSRFMACLDERIARWANAEDQSPGRFWQGRFSCSRLEDEQAVISCMAYVDLNAVRAGLCLTPEAYRFASVYDRVVAEQARQQLAVGEVEADRVAVDLGAVDGLVAGEVAVGDEDTGGEAVEDASSVAKTVRPAQTTVQSQPEHTCSGAPQRPEAVGRSPARSPDCHPPEDQSREASRSEHLRQLCQADQWLCPIEGVLEMVGSGCYDLDWATYLRCLDQTGRAVHQGKRGAIPRELEPILERCGLEASQWVSTVCDLEQHFGRFVGSAPKLAQTAKALGQKWVKGQKWARRAFRSQPQPQGVPNA